MKVVFVFCIVSLLLIGCAEPNLDDPETREKVIAKAIDADSLQNRRAPSGEELRYAPNQERPYSGWVKSRRTLYQFQNGKRHGTYISWDINQQNCERGIFRDGERNGLWTEWYENGQKRSEGSYKEGWKEGMWTEWYENGQKRSEGSYKEGWKGGMWIEWSMNGQIHGKGFYKKGQIENGGALTPQIHGGKQVDSGGGGALTPIEQETTSESTH